MSSKKGKQKFGSVQLTEKILEPENSTFCAYDTKSKMLKESKNNKRKSSGRDDDDHLQEMAEGAEGYSPAGIDSKQATTKKKRKKVTFDVTSTVTEEEHKSVKKQKHKMKPKKKPAVVKPKDEKLLKKKALKYLKQWKKDRSNWKFEKLRQVWLIQNMFDAGKVPEKKFPLLVDYIVGAKGSARVTVHNKAQEVMQAMEQWTELVNQGLEETEISSKYPDLKKVSEESYSRARMVLQSFKEEPSV